MTRRKDRFSQGVDTKRESTIIGGREMSSQTYYGVEAVKQVGSGIYFGEVLVEIKTYSNRTYHFAIGKHQLRQLLEGGK